MKALSWKEPFGSLMLHGKIETRTWRTDVHGPILICCSKKAYDFPTVMNISGEDQYKRIIEKLYPTIKRFKNEWSKNNGMAIAIGTLVGCKRMVEFHGLKFIEDACFVQAYPNLWCHLYENVIALPEPFPVKGQMGFFNVPDYQEKLQIHLLEWYNDQIK